MEKSRKWVLHSSENAAGVEVEDILCASAKHMCNEEEEILKLQVKTKEIEA